MHAKTVDDLLSILPSEAALEANILRYLANCLERRHRLAEGAITLTSPTQREEKGLGFDAMAGLPNGRYVVLQFKRPKFNDDTAFFKLQQHQFCALKKYPARSAFYVLPTVRDNQEMWDARTCLLDRTLAVDVQDMSTSPHLACPMHLQARGKGGGSGHTLAIRIDLRYGTACAEMPPSVLHHLIPYTHARSLCCDSDRMGFVIRNGKVLSRDGDNLDSGRKRDAIMEPETAWEPAGQDTPDSGGNAYLVRVGDAPS